MKDAQGSEIRRGERILDANGDVFMVKDVGHDVMHIQGVKTGRRYTIGLPLFVKMPPRPRAGEPEMGTPKMDTRQERMTYFRKRAGRLRH